MLLFAILYRLHIYWCKCGASCFAFLYGTMEAFDKMIYFQISLLITNYWCSQHQLFIINKWWSHNSNLTSLGGHCKNNKWEISFVEVLMFLCYDRNVLASIFASGFITCYSFNYWDAGASSLLLKSHRSAFPHLACVRDAEAAKIVHKSDVYSHCYQYIIGTPDIFCPCN